MPAATVLSAIGNTPLVRLRALAPENDAEIWVKLEYLNPTGSMKDRMALSMIEGAERDGLVSEGTTVVEYTGGSTGPALALVCRAKGYRTRIVISDLRENTFFASIFIERESEVLSLDARPSDSIAVALRARAPILVNEKLLQPPPRPEAVEREEEPDEAETPPERPLTDEEKAEQLRRFLEKLNPEDFGKFNP